MSKKEDIHRIEEFIAKTKNKNYEKKEEFNELFEETRSIIFKFVLYYDDKRKTKKRQAMVFRFFIAAITGLGIAFPVLGSFFDNLFGIAKADFAQAGHSLLIVAASIYGIKNYYGSTNGHIRYAKTQLNLEKLITIYSIKFSEQFSNVKNDFTDTQKKEFYELLDELLNKIFKNILSETNQWGKDIENDENNFAAKYFKSIEDEKKKKEEEKAEQKRKEADQNPKTSEENK